MFGTDNGHSTPGGDVWGASDYAVDDERILSMASDDKFGAGPGYTPGERAATAERPLDNTDVSAGGAKFDAGKIRMDLVPMDAVMAEAAVYTYGAIKYDDWNWARGLRKGRVMAALLRHAGAYMLGEERDPESGLPHTWHMRCCTGMLVAGELRGVAIEDREEAVSAYHSVLNTFDDMKDPSGTAKNAGGTVV